MPIGDISVGNFDNKKLYYVNPKIKAGKFVATTKNPLTGEREFLDCKMIGGTLKNAYQKLQEGGKFGDKLEIHVVLEDEANRYNFGVDIRTSWFAGKFVRGLLSAKYMQQINLLIMPVKGTDSFYGLVTDVANKALTDAFVKEEMPKWIPVMVNGKQLNVGGSPAWDKSEQEAFIDAKLAEWLKQFPAQKTEGEPESDEAKFNRYFPQAAELSDPTVSGKESEIEELPF